jgi:hypothetical protein
MRISVLLTATVVFCGWTAADAQSAPPPVLRIYVEHVKPGKMPAHQKSEAAFVRAFTKANYPAHYIALESMTGGDVAWFVEEHASFAEVEQTEKLGEAQPLRSELDQATAVDGEYISTESSMIAVYRPDLSFRPEQAVTDLPKMRYVEVIHMRIKPGSDSKFVSAVKDFADIYKNIQFEGSVLAYQVIAGAPSGSFVVFEPVTSLAEWDKYPAIMKSLRETGGKKFQDAEARFNEITVGEESNLMSVSPKMSYVTKETAAADPDFWMPKTKPAAAKPAAKAPAKQPGQ